MKSVGIKVSAGVLAVATTAFALLYHGHTYDRAWEHDETHHWQRATCGCDEISGLEEHSVGDDGFCWICARPLETTAGVEYAILENEQRAKVVRFFGGVDQNRVNISSEYQNLPVTEIGEGAFESLDSLTTVILPTTVTSIGIRAFFGCSSLTDLQIQGKITTIDKAAFYGCERLEGFEIPKTVMEIGEFAFANCNGLTEVTIPDGVRVLSRGLFTGCIKLTEVTFGSGVTEIGASAFAHCAKLSQVKIPSGVTSIGDGAFNSCNGLRDIVLPESLTSIGEHAFGSIFGLKVYYEGVEGAWGKISIGEGNPVNPYYYSESEPAKNSDGTAYEGRYWRYVDGVPTVWEIIG